ncbi:MAG: hypothetical protein QM773_08285 [Hyphomonadaceae bacterium]
MKHAGSDALDGIEPLLEQLRQIQGLKEKSRGCFYFGGKGYLHFHEHGADELYADIGIGDFERLPSMTPAQRRLILKRAIAETRDLLAAKKR